MRIGGDTHPHPGAGGLAPGVFDLVTSGRIGGYIVSLDTAVALEEQQPEAVIYARYGFGIAGEYTEVDVKGRPRGSWSRTSWTT